MGLNEVQRCITQADDIVRTYKDDDGDLKQQLLDARNLLGDLEALIQAFGDHIFAGKSKPFVHGTLNDFKALQDNPRPKHKRADSSILSPKWKFLTPLGHHSNDVREKLSRKAFLESVPLAAFIVQFAL